VEERQWQRNEISVVVALNRNFEPTNLDDEDRQLIMVMLRQKQLGSS
jgi:hypothetical protein